MTPTLFTPSRASLTVALVLIGAVCFPALANADVSDQYLPQIPDAGGKNETKPEVQVQNPAPVAAEPAAEPAQPQTEAKKQRKGTQKPAKIQTAAPIDLGKGPGLASVIAIALLGVALVGVVLWLVARGRRTLADAEGRELIGHRPNTPRGEITGDGSTDQRRSP